MIVIVRLEVDDRDRRAYRKRTGQPGLATRAEIAGTAASLLRDFLDEAIDEQEHPETDRTGYR